MAEGLKQQQAQPSTHEELGFAERLALLVDREATYRRNNKITRLLKAAKLKLQANQAKYLRILERRSCLRTTTSPSVLIPRT